MEDDTIYIAGETLTDLEHALGYLEICDLPCGCLGFNGTVPRLLSQSLERALKTIDAETTEWADQQEFDYQGVDSVRELFLRIGRARTAAS